MTADGEARVRAILAVATPLSAALAPRADGATPLPNPPPQGGRDVDEEGDGPPSDMGGDVAKIRECAFLDQSDTDNARRLKIHFGEDLSVLARDGFPGGDWLAWDGKIWDFSSGAALALTQAQRIGGRIAAEAAYLNQTPDEARAIRAAAAFAPDDKSEVASAARSAANHARQALGKRKLQRWRFGVSSKNGARVKSMLEMAAPHLRKASSVFNAEPLRFACRNATIFFEVKDDPECPDPDVSRKIAVVLAREGHERENYLTGMVAAAYEPESPAPRWAAFLERGLPDPEVRRTVRAYASMGLLGLLAQKLMFHYGAGANGKSVFLAVLSAVIGSSLGVALPKETILGTAERAAGQASPDLIRLFGKRIVRIDELKENEAVREDLIKRLTGGDVMVVRDLFKGYLEFTNVATPHMVGNAYPKIDGTDEGIWRRMLVVHWGVTIPEPERKPFDAYVAELLAERAGILNWLIAGALDFLTNGLVVAPACEHATAEFRADMDPLGRFVLACVEAKPGARLQARTFYEAYKSWSLANALAVVHENRFGREMKRRFSRDDSGQTRAYLDIDLHDVPARPDIPGGQ